MNRKLEGKAVIITGGSQGLGRCIVDKMLDEGANVIFCARTDEDVKNCAHETGAAGISADVSKAEDCERLVCRCIELFGRADVLINNAGIHGAKGPIDEIDMVDFKAAVDVDLYGPINMIRAVLPYMKKQHKGKIINISGGGATSARPYFDAYSAAKTALVRLTENISREIADYNIDINAVSPGAMNTRLVDDIISAGASVGKESADAKNRKENGATPVEVPAELAVYLASDESDGISGRIISAVWDDWKHFAAHKEEIMESDLYTLRRVVK